MFRCFWTANAKKRMTIADHMRQAKVLTAGALTLRQRLKSKQSPKAPTTAKRKRLVGKQRPTTTTTGAVPLPSPRLLMTKRIQQTRAKGATGTAKQRG